MTESKILIIDDDREILFAMSAICEYKNWKPITALSVKEGVKKFKTLDPDLILMDYHLPKVNGIQGVKRIREISQDVPIIVLTVEEDHKVADKFIEAGASDFALKPIKAPDIIARIKVHMKLKNTMEYLGKSRHDVEKGISKKTLKLIKDFLSSQGNRYSTINEISQSTGLAYQTVHRYIQYLREQNKLHIQQIYGKVGRPKLKYRLLNTKVM